jgi:hypothetical protein
MQKQRTFNIWETYEWGWTFCMILINLFLTSTCIYILIYIENFYNYLFVLRQNCGEGGGEIGSGTALQAGMPRVPLPMGVSAIFFIDIISPAAPWSWF